MKKRETNVTIVTIAVFVATFMTAIEGTIVTTAMPTIIGSLRGIEIMNWVFSIYLLTNAMLTPIYGKLADKIGRKPIFLFGTIVFIIGSALCGLSNSMMALIISRGIQGVGAGAMMPVALTIIADLYPVEKRARILGFNSTAWGIASVAGPLAGGIIVDTIGWHWIFFINVPIGLVLLGLIWYFFIEPERAVETKKMDVAGSVMLMMTLLSLLIAFQFLGEQGFNYKILLLLLLTVASLTAFILIEKRAEDPVISLDLFQSRVFVIVNLVAALVSGLLMGIDVYIPMWMQGVLGMPAGIGGLVLAPLSILWIFGSSLASRWLVSLPIKRVLTRSVGITLAGAVALFLIPAQSPFIFFLFITAIIGTGLGATIVTSTVSAQSSVPESALGVATSFNTLVRTIGQTVMVSVFGIAFNVVTKQQLNTLGFGEDKDILNQLVNPQTAKLLEADILAPLRQVLYHGVHVVFGIGAFLVLVALLFTRTLKTTEEGVDRHCS